VSYCDENDSSEEISTKLSRWSGPAFGFQCSCERCAAIRGNAALLVMEQEVYNAQKQAGTLCTTAGYNMDDAIDAAMPLTRRKFLMAQQEQKYPDSKHLAFALLLEFEGGWALMKRLLVQSYRVNSQLALLQAALWGKTMAWLTTQIRRAGAAAHVLRGDSMDKNDGSITSQTVAAIMSEIYVVCCGKRDQEFQWGISCDDLCLVMNKYFEPTIVQYLLTYLPRT
jgi:hypothetical protein